MSKNAVISGKKKREELGLPHMTFVAADDWMDKLGYETFGVWLKFHTWVDRKDSEREFDRVPRSFENIFKKSLEISKSKFYRLIKPLWEYGLIDIIEYEESNRKTTKPKNIVVYEYPFHEISRKYIPLEKLRDWDKDYESVSKELGKTGGRPRKITPKKKTYILMKSNNRYRFKIETVKNKGFKIKTVEGFKNKTLSVSKLKPNNSTNNSINSTNAYNNSTNKESIYHEEIKNLDVGSISKKVLNTLIDRLILFNIDLMDIELLFKNSELNDQSFADVLNDVLKSEIKYSFKRMMEKSIEKKIDNINKKVSIQPKNRSVRKEVPLEEVQKEFEPKDSDDVSEEERLAFEAEKKKLFDRIKNYKNNKEIKVNA